MVGPMDGRDPVRDFFHYFSRPKSGTIFCPFRILNFFLNFLRSTDRTEIKIGLGTDFFGPKSLPPTGLGSSPDQNSDHDRFGPAVRTLEAVEGTLDAVRTGDEGNLDKLGRVE